MEFKLFIYLFNTFAISGNMFSLVELNYNKLSLFYGVQIIYLFNTFLSKNDIF